MVSTGVLDTTQASCLPDQQLQLQLRRINESNHMDDNVLKGCVMRA